jgi:hypothetical protein
MLRVKLFSIPEGGGFITSDNYEVDFVSLVNSDTYGPPPLVAPEKGQSPVARMDDMVLYINTDLVPAWIIERLDDE